jgi:hypothetical protein
MTPNKLNYAGQTNRRAAFFPRDRGPIYNVVWYGLFSTMLLLTGVALMAFIFRFSRM